MKTILLSAAVAMVLALFGTPFAINVGTFSAVSAGVSFGDP